MITNDAVLQSVARIYGIASENLRRDGFLQPCGFLLGHSGGVFVVGVRGDFSPASRALFARGLAELAIERNAAAVLIVHEAWVAMVKGGVVPDGFRPSLDPDRQEIVCFVLSWPGGSTVLTVNISRDSAGHPSIPDTFPGFLEVDGATWSGPMVPAMGEG